MPKPGVWHRAMGGSANSSHGTASIYPWVDWVYPSYFEGAYLVPTYRGCEAICDSMPPGIRKDLCHRNCTLGPFLF